VIDAKHLRGTCGDCPANLINGHHWKSLAKEQRKALKAQGFSELRGRGLCGRCYSRRRAAGTLVDVESVQLPREHLLAEYEIVCDPYDPLKRQAEQLAARVGMSFESVERALYRAGVRSKWDRYGRLKSA
jgi:hypothetical protein